MLVGLSGGKDSLTLLNLLLALQKKAPIKFHIGVCTVDPMTVGFQPLPLKVSVAHLPISILDAPGESMGNLSGMIVLQGYIAGTLGLDYHFESQPIIAEAETGRGGSNSAG